MHIHSLILISLCKYVDKHEHLLYLESGRDSYVTYMYQKGCVIINTLHVQQLLHPNFNIKTTKTVK